MSALAEYDGETIDAEFTAHEIVTVESAIPDYENMTDDEVTVDIKSSLVKWIENTIRIGNGLIEMRKRFEIERRDDYNKPGSGMKAYITEVIGITEATAYRYIRCAEMAVPRTAITPDAAWELARYGTAEDRTVAIEEAKSGNFVDVTKAHETAGRFRRVASSTVVTTGQIEPRALYWLLSNGNVEDRAVAVEIAKSRLLAL